jgi:hypothetical protein
VKRGKTVVDISLLLLPHPDPAQRASGRGGYSHGHSKYGFAYIFSSCRLAAVANALPDMVHISYRFVLSSSLYS